MVHEKKEVVMMMAAIGAVLGWIALGMPGCIGFALLFGTLAVLTREEPPHGKT